MPRTLSPLILVVLLALALPVGAEEDAVGKPAWWLTQAAESARKVATPDGQAASLVSVAAGWLEAGDQDRATKALQEALTYAEACEGCFGKVQRLVDVALMQHEAKDAGGARGTLEKAEMAVVPLAKATGARARASVAGAWHVLGEEDRAKAAFDIAAEVAKTLDADDALDVLASVAIARATAGDGAGADRALGALAALEGEDADAVLAEVRAAMADIALAGGDERRALELANGIQGVMPTN